MPIKVITDDLIYACLSAIDHKGSTHPTVTSVKLIETLSQT